MSIDIGAYYNYNYNYDVTNDTVKAASLRFENNLAASIKLAYVLTAFTVEVLAITLTLKTKSLKTNVFAKLYLSMATADTGYVMFMLFWEVPLTYLQPTRFYFSYPFAFPVVSGLDMMFFDVSVFCVLAIAVSRFVSIFKPQQYADIFNQRNTIIVIVAGWIVGILLGIPFYFPACVVYYMPSVYAWLMVNTLASWIYNWVNLAIPCTVSLTTLALNVATFVLLRRHSRKMEAKKLTGKAKQEAQVQRKREISFLAFSCICSSSLVVTELCYNVIILFCTNKWHWFVVNSVVPTLTMYIINPVAYTLLYKDTREQLLRFCKRRGPDVGPSTPHIATA